MIKGSEKESRLIKALKDGWGFARLEVVSATTGRHSIWASSPEQEGWTVHKVSGESKDPLNDLLDEAGVHPDDL